eukprot:scaffold293227_cov39-Tisochrysis_lutea.AAC.4
MVEIEIEIEMQRQREPDSNKRRTRERSGLGEEGAACALGCTSTTTAASRFCLCVPPCAGRTAIAAAGAPRALSRPHSRRAVDNFTLCVRATFCYHKHTCLLALTFHLTSLRGGWRQEEERREWLKLAGGTSYTPRQW